MQTYGTPPVTRSFSLASFSLHFFFLSPSSFLSSFSSFFLHPFHPLPRLPHLSLSLLSPFLFPLLLILLPRPRSSTSSSPAVSPLGFFPLLTFSLYRPFLSSSTPILSPLLLLPRPSPSTGAIVFPPFFASHLPLLFDVSAIFFNSHCGFCPQMHQFSHPHPLVGCCFFLSLSVFRLPFLLPRLSPCDAQWKFRALFFFFFFASACSLSLF